MSVYKQDLNSFQNKNVAYHNKNVEHCDIAKCNDRQIIYYFQIPIRLFHLKKIHRKDFEEVVKQTIQKENIINVI